MYSITNILLIIRRICNILYSVQNINLEIIEGKVKYSQTKQIFN